MQKSYIWLLPLLLAVSCGGSNENQQSQDKPTEVAKPSKEEKADEDLLKGKLNLTIEGETYEVTEFDKRRSEITWMNDNKITVRLNSLDREKGMQFLISGEDAYGEKPLKVSLDASLFEKANHGGLSFTGFISDAENLSTAQLLKGEATISKLDPSSLQFDMSFEGVALHTEIGSRNDTVPISGNISVQLDNAVDSRTTK
jgi:hypothetical protein